MNRAEKQWMAWADNELSPEEQAELLSGGLAPEERTLQRREYLWLREVLRSQRGGCKTQLGSDFNCGVLQLIEAEMERKKKPEPEPTMAFWGGLAWSGAVCVFISALLFAFTVPRSTSPDQTIGPRLAQVTRAVSPVQKHISAVPLHFEQQSLIVLWVDGIDYIP
ncbi:MAG: hypothetical protein ACFCU3_08140 [Verrucomicrobiales bacterium]